MSKRRLSAEKVDPDENAALDRWDDEGGSVAKLNSDAHAADLKSLSPSERQVLQCLGAAVVVEWNKLPTDVQRTLFKHASGKSETSNADELRARIARFLHDHKDDRARESETREEL